jgi:hypothetical protein
VPRIGRSRPASNYKIVLPTIFSGTSVGLTTPNIALAAPLLTPSAGATVALTTPNVALAAPLVTPGISATVALTTPNIALAAPALTAFAEPPFPQSPLGLDCELLLGTTWTDVSAYAYQRDGNSPPITITRGKPNEASVTDPSTGAWEWNNRDGRFSPKNPTSPNYGLLTRNTPVRWSTNATTNYLRLEDQDGTDESSAGTDYGTALAVTGSMEFRIQMQLSDWQPAFIAGRWDSGNSWFLGLNADGTVTFYWSSTGSNLFSAQSDLPLPFTRAPFALRVTFNTSNGTATFYTASTIDGTYTQFGDPISGSGGTSTSLYAASGTSNLEVGWSPLAASGLSYGPLHGRVYEARFYNGIGGTVVADGIFSAQSAGTTTWSDSAGRTWSLFHGAEISAREFRLHAQMSSQPPTWDKTGQDQAIQPTAGGLLRLIGQASNNVQSTMYRGITSLTGSLIPVAYWPMEDASGATEFGPAIGPYPMTWNGSPQLAADSSFLCSAPLPTFNNAAFYGLVNPYGGPGTTWVVRFLAHIQTLPSGIPELIQISATGNGVYIGLFINSSGQVQLTVWDPNLNALASVGPVAWPVSVQQPMWWSVEAQPSGSNVQYSVVTLQPGASVGYALSATTSSAATAGYVNIVIPAAESGWTDLVMGHVTVQSAWESLFNLSGPLDAWVNEPAGTRYARLAKENGYTSRIIGAPSVSALMGPQGISTLPTLLQECETADMGQIFETRSSLSLGYRTLASMLSQSPTVTVDYSQAMLGGAGESTDSGLSFTFDDLYTKNDWTVTQGSQSAQGSSYRAFLNDGSEMAVNGAAGDYPSSVTMNLASSNQLPDAAGWRVHLGTVDEARWASIPYNLARAALSAQVASLTLMDVGDTAEMINLPQTISYDPILQIQLGINEDLGAFFWWIITNGAPGSPYSTGVYDDLAYGRNDTDGSTLATSVNATATSLSIATTNTANPLWTTNPSDCPFDINIAGERITVNSVTGSSSPQTLGVTRSVNGVVKPQTAGTDVRLWFPPIYSPI